MNDTTQQVTESKSALVERLRNASHGYDEWRVQDPKDGSYCMAFSWPETMHPERAAREWLADHKDRFPGGLHSDYVVACVRVMPEKDRLLLEASDELERIASGPWLVKCPACGHEHDCSAALGRSRGDLFDAAQRSDDDSESRVRAQSRPNPQA